MMDESVMRRILLKLEELIPQSEWGILPSMFERVYQFTYRGRLVYGLSRWDEEVPVLCFDVESGDFVGMELPGVVLEHGVLL